MRRPLPDTIQPFPQQPPLDFTLAAHRPDTPDFEESNSGNWVNVMDFGAQVQTASPITDIDNAAFFQNAIDNSGATVVYIPRGIFTLEKPVYLRGTVRKLVWIRGVPHPHLDLLDLSRWPGDAPAREQRGHGGLRDAGRAYHFAK